jgi:hypothetical protein
VPAGLHTPRGPPGQTRYATLLLLLVLNVVVFLHIHATSGQDPAGCLLLRRLPSEASNTSTSSADAAALYNRIHPFLYTAEKNTATTATITATTTTTTVELTLLTAVKRPKRGPKYAPRQLLTTDKKEEEHQQQGIFEYGGWMDVMGIPELAIKAEKTNEKIPLEMGPLAGAILGVRGEPETHVGYQVGLVQVESSCDP